MKDIVLAIKLMISFFLLTTLILFFIRLSVATIFLIKNGYFYFEWIINMADSLKRGAAIGSVLGIGIWLLSKMRENKGKSPPSDPQ